METSTICISIFPTAKSQENTIDQISFFLDKYSFHHIHVLIDLICVKQVNYCHTLKAFNAQTSNIISWCLGNHGSTHMFTCWLVLTIHHSPCCSNSFATIEFLQVKLGLAPISFLENIWLWASELIMSLGYLEFSTMFSQHDKMKFMQFAKLHFSVLFTKIHRFGFPRQIPLSVFLSSSPKTIYHNL